ncbi:hypothetical protein IWZ03DRAFT_87267 [Phyllosticta citriasiana]|uniref:Synaptobrevin n=1 Tax=Phyllosticta citriasiana TaxID=595635 RepID=A0ABR1KDJ1_9PEZI
MARTQALPAHQPDTTAISLARLLDRLERSLLSADAADPQLRSSSHARTKVGANLEYARSLLLRLEHDTAAIKIGSRRQAQQDDLQAKRELIKRLNQRLYELNQLEDEDDHDDDEYDVAEEEGNDSGAPSAMPPPSSNAKADSTLRSRRQQQSSGATQDTGTSTSLFTRTPSQPANPADPRLQKSETLLSHHRAEQETLTASLLHMAQSLRESSQRFSTSLEEEKDVLDRAGKGLDRGSEGMQAAGQRMGTLRRMTEGKGWWARVQLYGFIGGLWLACLVVMFVMPKLRF